jgi:hypothetical protein
MGRWGLSAPPASSHCMRVLFSRPLLLYDDYPLKESVTSKRGYQPTVNVTGTRSALGSFDVLICISMSSDKETL